MAGSSTLATFMADLGELVPKHFGDENPEDDLYEDEDAYADEDEEPEDEESDDDGDEHYSRDELEDYDKDDLISLLLGEEEQEPDE